ncbi:RICIN domain-containing protein [Kitasatospora purpeofusca]|uniref:RICIN domain-containing protein n=1 Tax=Kitasatospora purpeofusca TaxID=67352 RepID=UPI0033E90B16
MKLVKRTAALAASTAVLAGGLTFLSTGPASAASGYVTLTNLATSRVLDSNGNGSVYTLGANGGSYQVWWAGDEGNETYTFKNLATGRCLDSNGDGKVYTLGCNGGNYQKWVKSWGGNGAFYRNVATGRYLDSNVNGDVYAIGGNGGNYQKWN